MSRDREQLTVTCSKGHRLVEIGPDANRGGLVTARWHYKEPGRFGSHGQERGGYRVAWTPWPDPDPDPKIPIEDVSDVWVMCRCYRGEVPVFRVGQAYDHGLRGRHPLSLFLSGR